jgi:murein DD-endopeptidase MepM/ murein hydrolase activator NlpD
VAGKFITLLIVPDDEGDPKRYRMPLWLYRTLLVSIVVIVLAPIAYIALYYDVIAKAADADRLIEENESLRRYQYKVQILEQSLMETRQLMADIAAMAGLDSVFLADLYMEEPADTSANSQPRLKSISRTLPPTSPIPDGFPATGWISRGFSDIPGKHHSGIDLALPVGSPVYATAFGVVESVGFDSIFGETVVLSNNDSIKTVYGHNSQLLVQVGDTVFAGQRIALSGNTGISSAPHLHYEIRVNGKAINPIKFFVHENQTK